MIEHSTAVSIQIAQVTLHVTIRAVDIHSHIELAGRARSQGTPKANFEIAEEWPRNHFGKGL